MIHKEFEAWLEDTKKSAVEDFGYSEAEVSAFTAKIWGQYYDQGLTPFESILQHLKKSFNHQNGK